MAWWTHEVYENWAANQMPTHFKYPMHILKTDFLRTHTAFKSHSIQASWIAVTGTEYREEFSIIYFRKDKQNKKA